jgi:hypothetical protein
MRNRQNTLLAGVAALALVAGTGIALAQQTPQSPQGQNSAPAVSGQTGTQAQSTKQDLGAGTQHHAQTGTKTTTKPGGGAAMNTKGGKANQPSMARQGTLNGANKTAQRHQEHLGAATKIKHGRSTAMNEHGRGGRMNTAERNERNPKGLQGNASMPMQGNQVSLTPGQRSHIRDTVIDARGAPRVGHVNFDVRVGTLVPRRDIRVIPVPQTLVRIDPGWRGFLYFVVRDDVVIVNPRDMRIVAVIPA